MILVYSTILPFLLYYVSKKINYKFNKRDLFFLVPVNILIAHILSSSFFFVDSILLSTIICINLMSLNIDLYYQEIPDSYNLVTAILGLVLILFNRDMYSIMFFVGAFTFVFYLILAILSGGGLGGGDIKMGGALGISLPLYLHFYKGYLWSFDNIYIISLQVFINFLLFTSVAGIIMSLLLVAFKGAKSKTIFPYGPSILIGYLFLLLFSISHYAYIICIYLVVYSFFKILNSGSPLETFVKE